MLVILDGELYILVFVFYVKVCGIFEFIDICLVFDF